MFVIRPAFAGGMGPIVHARVLLLAGVAVAGLFFSTFTFSSCSNRFFKFSGGNSASSLYSSMHLMTTLRADCSLRVARCCKHHMTGKGKSSTSDYVA